MAKLRDLVGQFVKGTRILVLLPCSAALAPALCGQHAGTMHLLITNPAPSCCAEFGWSVAAVGHENWAIGADAANAAYLFSTNGTLLTTFTNPYPDMGSAFGFSLAALDTNAIIIGAPAPGRIWAGNGYGTAYLFSRDGALMTTFSNPDVESFGLVVESVGRDKALIGAKGKAHLFSTNGTRLMTFTNPTVTGDFAYSAAAVNSNFVLFGSPTWTTNERGSAYLYDISGTLIRTFSSPSADSMFGTAVAAMQSNIIAIATARKTVSLFQLDGELVATLTNPAPKFFEWFGGVVRGLGNDKVLVFANDTNMNGAVCLFNYAGQLLNVFTNPVSTSDDLFGVSMAPINANTVIVGAPMSNAGHVRSGVALLFYEVDRPPDLAIRLTVTNTLVMSWPSFSSGWLLQEKDDVSAGWMNIGETVVNESMIVAPTNATRFYRLIGK